MAFCSSILTFTGLNQTEHFSQTKPHLLGFYPRVAGVCFLMVISFPTCYLRFLKVVVLWEANVTQCGEARDWYEDTAWRVQVCMLVWVCESTVELGHHGLACWCSCSQMKWNQVPFSFSSPTIQVSFLPPCLWIYAQWFDYEVVLFFLSFWKTKYYFPERRLVSTLPSTVQ